MDASFVYGSNQRLADTLREGIGGRLRVEFRDGRPWPPAAANKSAVCDQQTDEEPCYQFGLYTILYTLTHTITRKTVFPVVSGQGVGFLPSQRMRNI